MNILINFRYLTGDQIRTEIIKQVSESNELDEIVDDFRKYADNLRGFDGNIEKHFLKKNEAINTLRVKNTKTDIERMVNARIEEFNQRLELDSYLFLDEICTIFIKNGKAIPMEDPTDYVNFKDVKRLTQEVILRIAEYDEDFELKTYTNVLYLVYIDIIEKGEPILIL